MDLMYVHEDRVIAALAREPSLAWLVAKKLRVLGTWEPVGQVGESMCRWDPWRKQRTTLRSTDAPDGGFTWHVRFFDEEENIVEVDVGGNGTDHATVLARADEVLRSAGYILVDDDG